MAAPEVGPGAASCPVSSADQGGGGHTLATPTGAGRAWRRDLLHTTRGPMTATATEAIRMGNTANALSSASVWQSCTNSDHSARAVAAVAGATGKLPMFN